MNTVLPIRETEVLSPSDMVGFGDAYLFPDWFRDAPFDPSVPPGVATPVYGGDWLSEFADEQRLYDAVMPGLPANDTAVRAMKRRHNGRWNIGFCEGHVEALQPIDLFDTRNPLVTQRWNNDHLPHTPSVLPGNGGIPPCP